MPENIMVDTVIKHNFSLEASLNDLLSQQGKQNINHIMTICLSYDVAVFQWLTSCRKNHMTTRYITLGYWRVTS